MVSQLLHRNGICTHAAIEELCCDGSDERPGVCPNRCKEVGEAYRKKRDAELKIQKTGSKIRSTYIAFAHKEQKRLQDEVRSLEKEIAVKEKEVDRLRGASSPPLSSYSTLVDETSRYRRED